MTIAVKPAPPPCPVKAAFVGCDIDANHSHSPSQRGPWVRHKKRAVIPRDARGRALCARCKAQPRIAGPKRPYCLECERKIKKMQYHASIERRRAQSREYYYRRKIKDPEGLAENWNKAREKKKERRNEAKNH